MATCTSTTSHAGSQNSRSQTCRDRGDALARSSRFRMTAHPIPWSSEHPSATDLHCNRTAVRSSLCLAHRATQSEDTTTSVRATCHETCFSGRADEFASSIRKDGEPPEGERPPQALCSLDYTQTAEQVVQNVRKCRHLETPSGKVALMEACKPNANGLTWPYVRRRYSLVSTVW